MKELHIIHIQVGRNWKGCPVRVMSSVVPPYVLPPYREDIKQLDDNIPDTHVNIDISNAKLMEGFEIKLIQTIAEKRNFNIIFT